MTLNIICHLGQFIWGIVYIQNAVSAAWLPRVPRTWEDTGVLFWPY